ncbi:MAG: glycoside hydrolase domain-containing protein [Mycobacteriales bacterium]
MVENCHLYSLPDGAKGFDTDRVVTDQVLAAAKAKQFTYIGRYVPRATPHDYDLSLAEAKRILDAGFGLFLIQHVALPGWVPTAVLGTSYGATAAAAATALNLPPGISLVLDLEGVKPRTPAADTIAYANDWHSIVAAHGPLPAIYLGWRSGLSGSDAYRTLRFTHYIAAYNLDGSAYPIIRGVQMQQKLQIKLGGILVDPQVATADQLGGRFVVLRRDDGLSLAPRRKAGAARRGTKRRKSSPSLSK